MSKVINYIKKGTAVILAVVMVGNIFASGSNIAFALEEQLSELEEQLIEDLSEELGDENIEVENLEVSLDEIVVEVSVEDATGEEVYAAIEFAPGDTYITLITLEYNDDGFLEEREYIVDISEMEDYAGLDGEDLEFLIEDVETGEIFEYDMDEGVLSIFWMGGLKLGLSAIGGLLFIGKVMIFGGILWKVKFPPLTCRPRPCPCPCPPWNGNGGNGENGANGNNGAYNYFEAMTHDGTILIGSGLSTAEAAARLRSGENTWSPTVSEARGVARQAGNRLPFGTHNDSRPNGRRDNCYMSYVLPSPRTGGRAYFGNTLRRGVR